MNFLQESETLFSFCSQFKPYTAVLLVAHIYMPIHLCIETKYADKNCLFFITVKDEDLTFVCSQLYMYRLRIIVAGFGYHKRVILLNECVASILRQSHWQLRLQLLASTSTALATEFLTTAC
jgi:hypothetical protein